MVQKTHTIVHYTLVCTTHGAKVRFDVKIAMMDGIRSGTVVTKYHMLIRTKKAFTYIIWVSGMVTEGDTLACKFGRSANTWIEGRCSKMSINWVGRCLCSVSKLLGTHLKYLQVILTTRFGLI